MVKTLILVRHGKPQPSAPDIPDFDRALTAEGIAALAAPHGLARTFSLLTEEEREHAVIWSSPAVRAMQTAQRISDALGGTPVVEKSSLWYQESGTFLNDVEASDAACLIAVGHIPFMNEMAAYLTGSAISFTPGAAAAIELADELDLGAGTLSWYVQGPAA